MAPEIFRGEVSKSKPMDLANRGTAEEDVRSRGLPTRKSIQSMSCRAAIRRICDLRCASPTFRLGRAMAAGLLVSVGAVTLAQAACKPTEARVELRIFRYGGVESDTARNKFSLFHRLLVEKLKHLQTEAMSAEVGTQYLEKLKIIPRDIASIPEPPEGVLKQKEGWAYWQALVLLSGALDEERGVYQVTSSIYWGDLKPEGLRETIYARMPVTPEGQRNASDTHSLITLVALAVDAKRRDCHSAVVLHLLKLAQDTARDIEKRNELEGDLIKLKAYIEDQIKLLIPK